MIIYYHKQTGNIFGVIDGRVHDNPESYKVVPQGMAEDDVGWYAVPFKAATKDVEVPIEKYFMIDEETGEVEKRVVGTEIQQVPDGMVPDVPFANLIVAFESGAENIYTYKVLVDENGVVTGFEKTV